MKITLLLALVSSILFCCNTGIEKENAKLMYLVDNVPDSLPIYFKVELVPEGKIIHRGIFSPDLQEYYYTISDKEYEKFDVLTIHKESEKWSEPKPAFFNSDYNEHGMSFSPTGNLVYFSSTRPTGIEEIPVTWHIWKSEKLNGKWSQPEFVNIPNLRNKLVSHPTATNSGTIYFHVSNLDYSSMDIYYSEPTNGGFGNAKKLPISDESKTNKCTPYISPNEDYLLFASIGETLELMICFKDKNGEWANPKKLSSEINSDGQGNPWVTPDNKFLFYAAGKHLEKWSLKWVRFESVLNNNP